MPQASAQSNPVSPFSINMGLLCLTTSGLLWPTTALLGGPTVSGIICMKKHPLTSVHSQVYTWTCKQPDKNHSMFKRSGDWSLISPSQGFKKAETRTAQISFLSFLFSLIVIRKKEKIREEIKQFICHLLSTHLYHWINTPKKSVTSTLTKQQLSLSSHSIKQLYYYCFNLTIRSTLPITLKGTMSKKPKLSAKDWK